MDSDRIDNKNYTAPVGPRLGFCSSVPIVCAVSWTASEGGIHGDALVGPRARTTINDNVGFFYIFCLL